MGVFWINKIAVKFRNLIKKCVVLKQENELNKNWIKLGIFHSVQYT